jgi:hypothetical protein
MVLFIRFRNERNMKRDSQTAEGLVSVHCFSKATFQHYTVIYTLSMEQSPSLEADSHSASQEISRI